MKFFDLHCDTIGECANRGLPLRSNQLDIDLRRASGFDKWRQVFAIWMPDEHRGEKAAEYFERVYKYYIDQTEKNTDVISRVTDFDNCREAKSGAILAVEGGSVLCGEIERVGKLFDLGVRIITITWNGSNELGHGSRSGCEDGLTDFGRRAVKEMERVGIVPDVSHLNERGFYDVAEICRRPFIASHSDSARVFRHPRNLTDGQIEIINGREGLIGINFFDEFLGADGSIDALYAHIAHMLEIGSENTLALGSDYDGCTVCPELRGIENVCRLYEYLLNRNVSENVAKKIFWDNADRFFAGNCHR